MGKCELKKVALWMYRNDGGYVIVDKLCRVLKEKGYEVLADFDMRECYCYYGKVYTRNGDCLSDVDIMYHMNADEQSDFQADILRFIEQSGVHVFNSFDSYNKGKDKMLSNLILTKAGIQVPPALFVGRGFEKKKIKSILEDWGEVLIKPRGGHGGRGIIKVRSYEEFEDFYEATKTAFDNYYIEKYIEFGDYDIRVEIFNGKVVGGYSRKKNHSFKTNISSGGEMSAIQLKPDEIETALAAANAIGIITTIVDMIRGKKDDKLYVLEVNYQMGIFVEQGMKSRSKFPNDVKIDPRYTNDDMKLWKIIEYIDNYLEKNNYNEYN